MTLNNKARHITDPRREDVVRQTRNIMDAERRGPADRETAFDYGPSDDTFAWRLDLVLEFTQCEAIAETADELGVSWQSVIRGLIITHLPIPTVLLDVD